MSYADADTELETYWRAIVLYGRNVASYKFALAKSLLELSQAGKDSFIRLTALWAKKETSRRNRS